MAQRRKRYRVDDLTVPKSTGGQVRPVDGFVNFATPPPDFSQEVADFTPLALAITKSMAKAEKEEAEEWTVEGAEYGGREDAVETLKLALDKAAEGLSDPDEITKAHRVALRKLAETQGVPAAMLPDWLIGVSRMEASRVISNIDTQLLENEDRFTILSDENGDLAEPDKGEAQQFAESLYAEALDSPLITNSPSAKEMLVEAQSKGTNEFLGRVHLKRWAKQEERAKWLRVDRIRKGYTKPNGETFIGLDMMGEPSIDATSRAVGKVLGMGTGQVVERSVIENVEAMLADMRDNESVPNIHLEFMDALKAFQKEESKEDPDRTARALSRLLEIELMPGLPIERDKRPEVQVIIDLIEDTENQQGEQVVRSSQAARARATLLDKAYGEEWSLAQEANPDASPEDLHTEALIGLEQNPEWLEVVKDTHTPVSEGEASRLSDKGDSYFQSELSTNKALSAAVAQEGISRLGQGENLGAVRDWVEESGGPSALREFDQRGGDLWTKLGNSQQGANIKSVAGRSGRPTQYGSELDLALDFLADDFERGVITLAKKLDSEGRLEELTASDEFKKLAADHTEKSAEITKPVDNAIESFGVSLGRGDSVGMDAAIESLGGKVSATYLQGLATARSDSARKEAEAVGRSNQFGDITRSLVLDFEAALVRSVENGGKGLLPDDAKALSDDARSRIRNELVKYRATISDQPREKQAELLQQKGDVLLEQEFARHFSPKQNEAIRFRTDFPVEEQAFRQAGLDMESYRESGSIAEALNEPGLPPLVGDPYLEKDFFSFPYFLGGITGRWAEARVRTREAALNGAVEQVQDFAGKEFSEGLLVQAKDLTDRWVRISSLVGTISPEDIIAGETTLRINAPLASREKLGSMGFSFVEMVGDFRAPLYGSPLIDLGVEQGYFEKQVKLETAAGKRVNPRFYLGFRNQQSAEDWIITMTEKEQKLFFNALGWPTKNLQHTQQEFLKGTSDLLRRFDRSR